MPCESQGGSPTWWQDKDLDLSGCTQLSEVSFGDSVWCRCSAVPVCCQHTASLWGDQSFFSSQSQQDSTLEQGGLTQAGDSVPGTLTSATRIRVLSLRSVKGTANRSFSSLFFNTVLSTHFNPIQYFSLFWFLFFKLFPELCFLLFPHSCY